MHLGATCPGLARWCSRKAQPASEAHRAGAGGDSGGRRAGAAGVWLPWPCPRPGAWGRRVDLLEGEG
jgi:hypothetical protein